MTFRPLSLETLETRRVCAGRVTLTSPTELVSLPNPTPNIVLTTSGSSRIATIQGTPGNDFAQVIRMASGATEVQFFSETIGGFTNRQTLSTPYSIDRVVFNAGSGDDFFFCGTASYGVIFGGYGNDRLFGGSGGNYIDGGEGDDGIVGGDGVDVLYGGFGADQLLGGAGGDVLNGDDGDDILEGGNGNDFLDGGANNDTLLGGLGADTLWGRSGFDNLLGGDDPDKLFGGDHNDTLDGGGGDDQLFGEAGDDTLRGGEGQDVLYGGDSHDRLFGDGGFDILYGENGDDWLDGGVDNIRDVLNGGFGNDTYRGDWVWDQPANPWQSGWTFWKRTTEICVDYDAPFSNQTF